MRIMPRNACRKKIKLNIENAFSSTTTLYLSKLLTYAVSHPRAVVIELRYTPIAHTTVFGPHWLPYL